MMTVWGIQHSLLDEVVSLATTTRACNSFAPAAIETGVNGKLVHQGTGAETLQQREFLKL
jgi:hypothetical protein